MSATAPAFSAVETPVETVDRNSQWSLPLRVLFRFAFCYFLLYSLPETGRVNIIGIVPGAAKLIGIYTSWWHRLCPWVGINIFHQSGQAVTYFPTGSGDTTMGYVENFCYLVFALFATLVWSVFDRRREDYAVLHDWFRIWIRYVLAFTLFGYGFAKVFPLQFQPPRFSRLVEPWGDFSPMGALWSFMGASIGYIIFSGLCEVLGGLFLLFRRTALLGALVSFGVLANVAALNYFYDVPVKLYSTNLVLMAVFLMAPDLPRLYRLFVLNRATEPAPMGPVLPRRWMRIAATCFWIGLVGWQLYNQINGGWQAYKTTYVNPQRPPLFGLYEVETFTRNGKDQPPLLTDATRWRRMIVQFPTALTASLMNDSLQPYTAEYDAVKHTVTLSTAADKTKKYPFNYSWTDPDHLVLEGNLAGDAMLVKLRKVDTSKKLLLSRGYHWINEFPFNR